MSGLKAGLQTTTPGVHHVRVQKLICARFPRSPPTANLDRPTPNPGPKPCCHPLGDTNRRLRRLWPASPMGDGRGRRRQSNGYALDKFPWHGSYYRHE